MNDTWLVILGAALAIAGGWVSYEIRSWRDRDRELSAIKIAIGDELFEIEETINKMNEVWREAKVLSPSYINELLENTEKGAFNSLRSRLFLIKDGAMRKKIVSFYKRLRDALKKSKGKLGTLADSPAATHEQESFNNEFQAFVSEAKSLREEMEK